jgi:tRNA pseudouridine55 synthase
MNPSGIIVINKPSGLSSHDVITELRRILRIRRIGHAGTLDPQATGILLACMEKGTKVAQFLTEYDKEYEAVIRLGITTDTYDGEGEIIETKENFRVNPEEISKVIDSFMGNIRQTPPLYSAIKFKGKKLYQYARAKEEVEIKKRDVEITDIEIIKFDMPDVRITVSCSKGTYIRSLAHDIGQKLGCGAYLFSLCRTRVGPYNLIDALGLQEISHIQNEGRLAQIIIPIEEVLAHLPSVVLKEGFTERIKHGAPLVSSSVSSIEADFKENQTICVKNDQRKIVAIGKALSSAVRFLDSGYKSNLIEYIRVIAV